MFFSQIGLSFCANCWGCGESVTLLNSSATPRDLLDLPALRRLENSGFAEFVSI